MTINLKVRWLRSMGACMFGVLIGVGMGLLMLRVAQAVRDSSTPVVISGFKFTPQRVTIRAGEVVTWTNNDGTAHTATALNGSFNSGPLSQGSTYTHAFTVTGVFSYMCSIHSSMTGTIQVISATQVYVPVIPRAGQPLTMTQ